MSNDNVTEYLCKDCVHSHVSILNKFAAYAFEFRSPPEYSYRCKKTLVKKHINFSPVTGPERVEAHMDHCGVVRTDTQACGPNGEWWTPKHKKDLFKLLKR